MENHDNIFLTSKRRFQFRKEDVIENIKEFNKIYKNHRLTLINYKKWDGKICSPDTICRMFGNWESALEKSEINGWYKRKKYSDDEILDYFECLWIWRGQKPSLLDFKKYNSVTGKMLNCDTIRRRFGNYKEFCNKFSDYKTGKIGKWIFKELKQRNLKKTRERNKLTPRLRALVLARDNKTCQDCGISPRTDKSALLHVHHIKPINLGGETILENLITNCDQCNLGKSDKILDTMDLPLYKTQ